MKMYSFIALISLSSFYSIISASGSKDYKQKQQTSAVVRATPPTAAAGTASSQQQAALQITLKKIEPHFHLIWQECAANGETDAETQIISESEIIADLQQIKATLRPEEYRAMLRVHDPLGRTLLFRAFDCNRYEVLRFLYPDSDPAHTTAAHQTILFHAIKLGTLDQLKKLWAIIGDSTDINQIVWADGRGITALAHAIFSHDLEKVDFVINVCGAHATFDDGEASYLPFVEMARSLLTSPTIIAGEVARTKEPIEALLKKNLQLKSKFEKIEADNKQKKQKEMSQKFENAMQQKNVGATFQVLGDSMKFDRTQTMHYWQRAKGRFSATEFEQLATMANENDHTLLMQASQYGYVEIVRDLCECSPCNVNHVSKLAAKSHQDSAVSLAMLSLAMQGFAKKTENDALQILSILFKHKATAKVELLSCDSQGRKLTRTPLMIAVQSTKPQFVASLLQHSDQAYPVANQNEQSYVESLLAAPNLSTIKKMLDQHIAQKKAQAKNAQKEAQEKTLEEEKAQKDSYIKELKQQFEKLGQTAPDFALMNLSTMLNKIQSNKKKIIKRAQDEALKDEQEKNRAIQKAQLAAELARLEADRLKASQTPSASVSTSGSAASVSALAAQSLETEDCTGNVHAKPEDNHKERLARYLKKKEKQEAFEKSKSRKAQSAAVACAAATSVAAPLANPAQAQEKSKAKSKAAELEALEKQYALVKKQKGKSKTKVVVVLPPAQQIQQSNAPKKKG